MSASKRTLCIVNPFEHGGGAEYQIGLLMDVLVASNRYNIHYLAHFVDARARTRNYNVHRIGKGGPIPRLGYVMDGLSLYRKLREIGPALIYQRVACAYTGICALFSRRNGVPLLWQVAHDTDVMPQLLDVGRNLVRLRLEKLAVEFGLRHASAIAVQTERQAALLQRHYHRAADIIVRNFHPSAAEPIDKSGPLTVVWIANLKPWKRPEVFVRLAGNLSALAGVRFVMVGAPTGTSGKQSWQEGLMRSIGLTANLQYLGEKSQSEVNQLLARVHIFVNTSTQEGFPNTFIQSWLRDVAVVSLDVDPDQVLEREHVGILAGSETHLAAAVRDLVEHPEVRAGYVQRGREHAVRRHSMLNAQALVRLIDRYSGGRS